MSLARVTSVRFTAYYAVSLAVGLGAGLDPWQILAVIGYCLVFCVAVESLNRISDRTEDEVNQPARTALCHRVGYDVLRRVCAAAWAAVVLLDVAWVLAYPGWVLAVLLAFNLAVGVGYSVGPRLKGHRATALLVLTGTLSLPLLTGYATYPDDDRRAAVLTAAVLVTLVSLTTAGAKDVTDEAGDSLRDYRSLWLEALRRRRGLLATLVGLQLAVPVAVVATGTLGPAALLATLVVPVQAAVLVCVARAVTPADRAAAREAMHTSTLVAVGLILLGTHPSWPTAAAVAAGWAWWALASRFLHWNRLLSADSAARWAALLRGGNPVDHPVDHPVDTPVETPIDPVTAGRTP